MKISKSNYKPAKQHTILTTGEVIKMLRELKGWTQEELAQRVNVTRKTINTVENGKFIPSAYLAIKIAKAFGAPVEDIFQIDDDDVPVN